MAASEDKIPFKLVVLARRLSEAMEEKQAAEASQIAAPRNGTSQRTPLRN